MLAVRRGAWIATALVTIVGCALSNAACSSSDSAPTQASACDGIAVDRFKELEVVDVGVSDDARGHNRTDGAWSFRHMIETLTPPGTSTSDFVLTWMSTWNVDRQVNLFALPRRPQAAHFVCDWLRRTPANACNEDCTTCTARTLDLAEAPFRLMGVSNRLDLHETEDRDGSGETRLAFALVSGAADDPASAPLQMSVAFEYSNPGTKPSYWAQRWHALGSHAAVDDSYRADLQALTDEVLARGPSALNQVRTNERVFDWAWDLREFKIQNGQLDVAATKNTPDKSLNGSDELTRFVMANRAAVLAEKHDTPPSITGGDVSTVIPWNIPNVDEEARHLFVKNTCNGCHQNEETPIDLNFHISPFKSGTARLSVFLNNPASPETDELARRSDALRRALCSD